MEIHMYERDHNIEPSENVNMLLNDLQYIDIQIKAIKADIKYVMQLVQAFDRELEFAKREALCPH